MKVINNICCCILVLLAVLFSGCPTPPVNPEDQTMEFNVVWKNNIGSSLEVNADWNIVDGVIFNAVDTVLRNGDSIVIAVVKKIVSVDSDHTMQMYEEEMLLKITEAIKRVDLRYFEDNVMYNYSGDGASLFGEQEEYTVQDKDKIVVISKEILSRAKFVATEGELATASINWQNDFVKPIGLQITSASNPEYNINRQIAPEETVKIVDLSYYIYPNDDELNAKMLANAMADYKLSLDDVIFTLSEPKDNQEWHADEEWTDSIKMYCLNLTNNYLFDLDNYKYDNNYTLILYNRLLYIDFDALQDTVIKHVHSVTWKNGMTVPMVVDIKYMRNSIYNISGDIYCTIQPGEIYEMPEFFYYEQKGAYPFVPWESIFWYSYMDEMKNVVITYGDKTYDMAVDGRRKFVSPSYNDLYYSYTFTEQSFEAESDAEYPE